MTDRGPLRDFNVVEFWRRGIKRVASPLILDQLASSGSNVLLVLIAARVMDTHSFAVFATVQLVNVTFIGIGRLSVYGPALSTQRHAGRQRIPATWVVPTSLALTAVAAPVAAWVLWRESNLSAQEVATVAVLPITVFVQDGLRYVRMSESRIHIVLSSDLVWLATTLPLVAFVGHSIFAASMFWVLGSVLGLVPLASRGPLRRLPPTKFGAAWALGRWGLLDAGLGALITTGPTVAATVFFNGSVVATYRVVQSAISPMNLMNSILAVSFGLGAWRLSLPQAGIELRSRVRRATTALISLSLLLLVAGVPTALWFAGASFTASWRPWMIVGIATTVGAWTSARQAAAQSLGMQRISAATRILSAIFTVAVIVLATRYNEVPDPIGVTLLGAAAIALIGSQLAFSKGLSQLGRVAGLKGQAISTGPVDRSTKPERVVGGHDNGAD